MKEKFVIGSLIVVVFGCSSSQKSGSEAQPDRVISRINDLGDRPDYINEAELFRVENGTVISTGIATIPTDDRVEAGYRIAQNNAKAAIAGAIEQRLEFVFQNAEEGTSMGTTQARYIGAEASKLTTSSIRLGKNYWEKVATITDSGERITQYKIFSTVHMPEAEFKRAILDAIRGSRGKNSLSKSFAEKVDAHWDQFTGKTEKSTRSAASEDEADKE